MRKDPCGQMVGTVWLVIVVLGTMVQVFLVFSLFSLSILMMFSLPLLFKFQVVILVQCLTDVSYSI